jgi:hypothetical protein
MVVRPMHCGFAAVSTAVLARFTSLPNYATPLDEYPLLDVGATRTPCVAPHLLVCYLHIHAEVNSNQSLRTTYLKDRYDEVGKVSRHPQEYANGGLTRSATRLYLGSGHRHGDHVAAELHGAKVERPVILAGALCDSTAATRPPLRFHRGNYGFGLTSRAEHGDALLDLPWPSPVRNW